MVHTSTSRVTRQMFRDVARVQFGAAVDRRAVPLDDDSELHCSGADGFDEAGSSGSGSLSRVTGEEDDGALRVARRWFVRVGLRAE